MALSPEPSAPRARFLHPDGLVKPGGYSQVVTIPAGTQVLVSGQVAFDSGGNIVGVGSWEQQTRVVMTNIARALATGGASWSDVVKLTVFLVDMDGLPTVRKVRDEFVSAENPPASSLLQVVSLVHPDLLLEVEAVAWRP